MIHFVHLGLKRFWQKKKGLESSPVEEGLSQQETEILIQQETEAELREVSEGSQ